MSGRIRVLVADDHVMIAQSLALLLQQDFDVVGIVADGRALVDTVERLRPDPDVVVADVSMPLLNGIDATRRLSRGATTARVVILTMHADPSLAAEALRAGAAGFVVKHAAAEELITAIREVAAGRIYVTRQLSGELVDRLVRGGATGADGVRLTPRQREILQLAGEGYSTKEMASMLGISRRTVETHKYQLMRALGARSSAMLVHHAIRLRLLTI
jgi:DNA-binding NarL/FixJ family response regulator